MNLVSIITPSYNSAKYIGKTIDSVISQTYKKWELIIIDDCSTDSSVEIIKDYENKDNRIKLIQLKENSGAAVARNTGIQLARGRFIAFLDSDDSWLPEKLEKQLKFMLINNYY
ncbi:TPA: glycosyltransferase family 2 protein, partial [Acinetobacter baumannii]